MSLGTVPDQQAFYDTCRSRFPWQPYSVYRRITISFWTLTELIMKNTILLFFLLTGYFANSQVLISLLLGDALNSIRLNSDLTGVLILQILPISNQVNRSECLISVSTLILSSKEQLMLHTGVIVKSSQGADKLAVYSLNDPSLDEFFPQVMFQGG